MVAHREFTLLQMLDDGRLRPDQASKLATRGIELFPEFAPLYLFLGNSSRDQREAITAYQKGLDLVGEPDLEIRLIYALAARLLPDHSERKQLLERTTGLKGSLVAAATAKLMQLQ